MSQTIQTTTFSSYLEVREGGDGRTVSGVVVPFDEPFDAGRFVEIFRKGAFARTIKNRKSPVPLLALHDDGQLPIGKAVELREDATGLVGDFRVSKTPRGDEALELVRDGTLHSFSVGFIPHRDRKNANNTVERLEVRIDHVGLVYNPAYESAKVLAMRDNDDVETLSLDVVRRRLAIVRTHAHRNL